MIKRIFLFVLLGSFLAMNLTAAAWHIHYEKALQAIEEKNWQQAIVELLAAIQDRAEPQLKAKTIGLRFVDYLPDYYLGKAYFAMANLTLADNFLAQADVNGVIKGRQNLYQDLLRLRQVCQTQLAAAQQTKAPVEKPVDALSRQEKTPTKTEPLDTTKNEGQGQESARDSAVNSAANQAIPAKESNSRENTKPLAQAGTISEQTLAPLLKEGITLAAQGKPEAALEKFNAILQLSPDHVESKKQQQRIERSLLRKKINRAIVAYFRGERENCERWLREADPLIAVGSEEYFTTSIFLAAALIEKSLLQKNADHKALTEAKARIVLILSLKPSFALPVDFFSPKVIDFFKKVK